MLLTDLKLHHGLSFSTGLKIKTRDSFYKILAAHIQAHGIVSLMTVVNGLLDL